MKMFKTKEYHIAAQDGRLLTAGQDNLIVVEAQREDPAQRWKFVQAADGCSYRILNVQSKKALDIIDGGVVNGAWTHQWDEVETPSQLWRIEEDQTAVRLCSLSSGKYLDVALEDATHVQIWERGGENQLWTVTAVEQSKAEKSTAIKEKEPSAIKHPDPTAIKEKEPSAIKHPDPTAIKEKEPSAIKHPDPTAIKEKEPSAIKHPDPTAIKEKEPSAIKAQEKAPARTPSKTQGKRKKGNRK